MSAYTHYMKVDPSVCYAVWEGRKTFEFRKASCGVKVNDLVILQEWDGLEFSGRKVGPVKVAYILEGGVFGIPKDYLIFCW